MEGVTDTFHDEGKMIGGQGALLVITAGAGAWVGAGSKAGQVNQGAVLLTKLNIVVSGLSGTANLLDAKDDFKKGNNGKAAAKLGFAVLDFLAAYVGVRGLRAPATTAAENAGSTVAARLEMVGVCLASQVELRSQAASLLQDARKTGVVDKNALRAVGEKLGWAEEELMVRLTGGGTRNWMLGRRQNCSIRVRLPAIHPITSIAFQVRRCWQGPPTT